MSKITCHVLDTALGRPARGLRVVLAVLEVPSMQDVQVVPNVHDAHEVQAAHDARDVRQERGVFTRLGEASTDDSGRTGDLLAGTALGAKTYRLTFHTGAYFVASAQAVFYPRVDVIFSVAAPSEPYHIPLLLSPFGYSTYRGR